LIGEKKPRQRVLNDDELRALLKATEILGYPIGECVRLILLTGCRLREIGEARWSEIDFAARLLIIPPERFKSGVSHRVPLSEDALQLLKGLPLRGEFLFTFTGSRPINGWSRAKDALDAHMEIDDLPDWKIHDLRHTMRTRMAAMRIPDIIAEMCLGHGKRGLQRVYDQYGYEPEIRDALQRWAALLRGIVEPVNVIELRRA
jgi:integrase